MPLATYTGWGLRSGVWANDGCEASGQYIPFKATAAERMAAGDPRPSAQERYPSFAMYRSGVMRAIDDLVRNRFMLCDDAGNVFARLQSSPQETVPACLGKKG